MRKKKIKVVDGPNFFISSETTASSRPIYTLKLNGLIIENFASILMYLFLLTLICA